MRRRGIILILFCIMLAAYLFATADNNGSLKIHPFTQSAAYCTSCHSKNDKKIINPNITCSELCLTCHKDINNHHKIDVRINKKLHEKFILTKKKRLTCITCHRLDNVRFDTSSWKAESLYEKVFAGKSQYKTYFLIKRNNDGSLCKICH